MGFAPVEDIVDENHQNDKPRQKSGYSHFLYVLDQHVVGLLVIETISKAYRADDGDTLVSSGQAVKAHLGIHLMWVHAAHRHQGIASRLVDVAREKSVFGYTSIAPDRVAFSSPTQAGLAFAQSYMKKHQAPVLVYRFASGNV